MNNHISDPSVDEALDAVREDQQTNPLELGELSQEIDEDDDIYDEDDSGVIGWLFSNWYIIAAVGVAMVLIIVIAVKALGGGGEASQKAQAPEPETEASAKAPSANGSASTLMPRPEVVDTEIVIDEPVQKGDNYYLKSGEVAWKGQLKSTENGEVLTLEGPTAAQFRRAIATPGGHIDTGTFGRAEPDGPMLHVMYQRSANENAELTSGTYFMVDGSTTVLQGFYSDVRKEKTVTRTYNEWDPNNPENANTYSVKFQSAPGVPVPALVGWEIPDDLTEPIKAG